MVIFPQDLLHANSLAARGRWLMTIAGDCVWPATMDARAGNPDCEPPLSAISHTALTGQANMAKPVR
jgi:hypothetical protein